MDDADLRCLEVANNIENISQILRQFLDQHLQTFTFDDLNKSGKKHSLLNAFFKILDNNDASSCHLLCLDCLRVLSRDKTGLNEYLDERKINLLLRLTGLCSAEEAAAQGGMTIDDPAVAVAALKALCNLTYNSTMCASLTSRSQAPAAILTRLRTYRDHNVPAPVKLFDIKLLFLITALRPESCPKLKEEHHAVIYLTEALDLVLKESDQAVKKQNRVFLTDGDVDLTCEILKVLFNLMTRRSGFTEEDTEDESLWLRLTAILHDLLISETSSSKREELSSNTVNLLTSVPAAYYGELVPISSDDIPKQLEFEGKSVEAVQTLLEFLSLRLTSAERSETKQELLSPIVTVLLQLSRKQRAARKYLKARILPPLKDVMSRPEEGDALRNQLCRLLTSPSSIVKDLVADFLFTLCKHNVSRMVKYTGYGNAAGLLASKGLMLGGRSHSSSSSYSSDSDSETEEYAKFAGQINPVVGCYEPPKKDPLEGMSEEQKEYEAVQLVNIMDKLSRKGLIQPCKVGEDGRPQPIEHVLELQEAFEKQQPKTQDRRNKDD